MANKKREYTIKINGVEQSITQVDNLNETIDNLSDKVKDVDGEYIKINVDDSDIDQLNDKLEQTVRRGTEFEDQFNSFNINIGGVEYQFDNIMQAIGALDDRAQGLSATLSQMRQNGKETTQEFDKLSREFNDIVRQSAILERARRYSDELRDSLASQTRTLDLVVQGFTAFGNALQIASGISGLFGRSQEEIEQSINRTLQIMAILQASQEIYNQTIQQGTILNRAWSVALAGADKVMKMFGASTVGTSTALKALRVAIASTGIGLLVIGITELVGWLGELTSSSNNAANNINKMSDIIDRRLNNSIKNITQAKDLGLISEFEALNKEINQTINYLDELQQRTNQIQGSGNLKLLQSVEGELRVRQSSGEFYDERQTDHYLKLLVELKNQADISSLSIEELNRLLNETSNGLNEFNVDNIKLEGFNEQELEQLKNFYNQSRDYYNRIYELRLKQQVQTKEINDQIDELEIQNIKDDRQREITEIEKKYSDIRKTVQVSENELVEIRRRANEGDSNAVQFLENREKLIKESYERQQQEIVEVNKNYARESQEIENQIINNRIASLRDGYSKELAQLNQSKREEIQAAVESEINVNEQIKAINEKYNRELINLNKTYYDERLELLEEYKNQVISIQREISESQYELATSKVGRESTAKQESLSYNELGYTDETNLTETLNHNLTSINSYYNEIYSIAEQQTEKLKNINLEKALFDFDSSKEELKTQLKEQLKTLQDALDREVITQEDYNKQKQDLTDVHNQQMLQLERNYNEQVLQIDNDYNNKRLQNEANRQSSQISNLRNQINEVNNLRREMNQPINIGDMNISLLGNVARNFIDINQFKDVFSQFNTEIDKQIKTLQDKFNKGEISFGDFKKLKSELDSLKETNQQTLDSLTLDWQQWAQNISQIGAAVVGMFSQLFTSIADMRYQNELNRIEREEELLDKELEMLDEQYEKQQEIYQKHVDEISSIEDELASARGDRRNYLVEQLGEEMNAQEAAWNAQQQIDRQRQANEKKQESLEKQKEAAERKRNSANKKIQIAQAVANTATAVTNALAVHPFFLGLALAAVAASMGAAQIAILSKVKYADGGLLNGKSHQQGGIPIGNTGIEVEGNEYVINKKSTKENLPLITYINENKKHLTREDILNFFDSRGESKRIVTNNYFANGGQLPQQILNSPNFNVQDVVQQAYVDDREIVVSVQEIERVSNRVKNVKALAGL